MSYVLSPLLLAASIVVASATVAGSCRSDIDGLIASSSRSTCNCSSGVTNAVHNCLLISGDCVGLRRRRCRICSDRHAKSKDLVGRTGESRCTISDVIGVVTTVACSLDRRGLSSSCCVCRSDVHNLIAGISSSTSNRRCGVADAVDNCLLKTSSRVGLSCRRCKTCSHCPTKRQNCVRGTGEIRCSVLNLFDRGCTRVRRTLNRCCLSSISPFLMQ